MENHKRRARNYLINKSLQLRYMAVVVILGTLISGTLGFLIYSQEREASESIIKDATADAPDLEVAEEIKNELGGRDRALFVQMAVAGGRPVFRSNGQGAIG